MTVEAKMREKGLPKQKCGQPQKLEEAKNAFIPEASRRDQPCQCLDFQPVRPVLDFWHPKLSENTFTLF